jgi:drug/metabolite transporter (DMT)-like permease
VNPIIAVFIGWLVAGEPVSPSMITATILIVTAVYLILKDQSPRSD